MKYQQNEDIRDWAQRVSMFERGVALQRLAKGDNLETILEDMSRRIVDKMMYPITKAVKEGAVIDQEPRPEPVASGIAPTGVADHVVDN